MAYYLTVKEKNNYKLLDISSLEEFQRLSKFKNNSYSLEEIDLFTSNFADEIELKKTLFEQGILPLEDITKEISIRRKNKDELIKVMYDLVYNGNSKFLNEEYLRNILLTLQNDKVFLNKLLNHYRNNYKQENLAKIRAILSGYTGNSINIYEALNSFFIEEIYDIDYNTGFTKIKYKSLHDLAMFIYTYLSQKGKSQIDIDLNKANKNRELEELKSSLTPQEEKINSKVYTRKRKYTLDEQTSFF